MFSKKLLPFVIASLLAGQVLANDDLNALKAQIAQQQAQLEQMMHKLQALETKTQQAEPSTAPTASAEKGNASSGYQGSLDQARAASRKLSDPVKVGGLTGNPFAGNRMNPDVAVIVDGSYINRGKSNTQYGALSLPSFTHPFGESHAGHNHGGMNMNNGFNLNYAELVFSAAVDNYFDLFAVVHAGEEASEIEEAYANTRSLPFNTQVKFGKFLSGFGRLNGQHHHYWDFADQPLIYQGVFGSHGLLEKGIQATWLAPTDTYLLLGVEALQGENEQSFGNTAIAMTNKGAVDGAGLVVAFAKTSFDLGKSSWMAGVSYATGQARHNHADDEENPHAKGGNRSIVGVDLTGKYFLDATRYLMWQSEYIKRDLTNGVVANYATTDADTLSQALRTRAEDQSGYYSQLILKFAPQWRTGVRYDAIDANNSTTNGVSGSSLHGDRNTLMVEYNPTEFSRIRLQYAQNSAYAPEGASKLEKFDEVMLQFNMAIGAHGAHSF